MRWLLAVVLLAGALPAQTRLVPVWDGVDSFGQATEANAMASAVRRPGKAGGRSLDAIFLHPQNAQPATRTWTVDLPPVGPGERLVFSGWAGLTDGVKLEDAQNPLDGVGVGLELDGRRLFRVFVGQPGWLPTCVDLAAYAGRRVKLVLFTDDGGGKGNVSYDWAMIGRPQIVLFRGQAIGPDGTVAMPAGGVLADLTGVQPRAELTVTPVVDGAPQPAQAETLAPTADGPWYLEYDRSRVAGCERVQVKVTGATATSLAAAPFQPVVRLKGLHPNRGVLFAGQAYELRATLENVGRGPVLPADNLVVTLTAPEAATRPVPRLNPGESATVVVPAPAAPAGELRGEARATLGEQVVGTVPMTVTVHPPLPALPGGLPLGPGEAGDAVVISQPKLRTVLGGGGRGPLAFYAVTPQGEKLVATAPAPAGLVLAEGPEPLGEALPVTGVPGYLVQRYRVGDAGRLDLAYGFASAGDVLTIDVTFTAGRDVKLAALYGPAILVGDGGTGTAKKQALFPGLEYLQGDEPSSSTRDFAPPLNDRTVPDPYKITVPVMAVETPDALVALEWNPNEKWHADRALLSAVFASPNCLDAQDNHRLQVFAPAGPELVKENTLTAKEPYPVKAGESVRVRQRLLVRAGGSVLDAVEHWCGGTVPEAEARPRSFEAELALSRHGFLHSVWDDAAKKSKHVVGWANTNAPQFGALLHFDALLTGSPEARERAELIARTTLAEQGEGGLAGGGGCHILSGNLPFFYGHLDGAFGALRDAAHQAMSSMAPDGSWAYHRPEEHALLGEEGAVELGTCARPAMSIWRWARMSGEPAAIAAGRKALARMDRFIVPAGAQGWECPIHEPDILASAYAIRAYVDAYETTGEKPYLEKAVYWARTGLPFCYLWQDPAKPGMRYATIPVFGSTFMTHSWLGLPVQWCGLVYAYGLMQLERYDHTLPWKAIARGITVSGMYQQWSDQDPKLKGTYPDSWGVYFTRRNGVYINPEDIILNDLALAGHDLEPATLAVPLGGETFRLTSGARFGTPQVTGDTVTVELKHLPGGVTCTAVPFVAKPTALTIGWRPARFGDDLDAEGVDATYDAKTATLFFRVAHGAAPVPVRIEGLRRAQPAVAGDRSRWTFTAGAGDWSADNHCQLTTAEGNLVCAVTGFDPYFSTRTAHFAAAKQGKLVVRARSTKVGTLGLFWGTDTHPGTAPERAMTRPLPADGQWHEVVFDLAGKPGWSDVITHLRLDPEPADVGEGARLEIAWVEARK